MVITRLVEAQNNSVRFGDIPPKMEKTKENFQKLVNENLTIKQIGKQFGIKSSATRYWLKKFSIKTRFQENKTNRAWDIQELKEIIKISSTKAQVLKKLHLSVRSGNYRTIDKYISYYNIDISHFTGKNHGSTKPKMLPLSEILILNSHYSSSSIKKRLIKDKVIDYICQICKLKPFWNNKDLVLILDHINGNNSDNRLQNLRFLCPNCNSQQPTFCRKFVK